MKKFWPLKHPHKMVVASCTFPRYISVPYHDKATNSHEEMVQLVHGTSMETIGYPTYPSRFVAFEHNEGRWTEHLFLRLVFYAACHNRVGIQQMLGCFFQTKWILIRKRRHFLVFYYPMLSPKVQHVFSWSFEDCKRYSTNSRADLNNYILNYM